MRFQDLSDEVRAFWNARVVLTAVELDLFTLLDGKPATAVETATAAGLSVRGTSILLDALAAMKLLKKKGALYSLADEEGGFLSDRREETRRGVFLHMNNLWNKWSRLTEAVRTGKPARIDPGPDYYHDFILAMHHGKKGEAAGIVEAAGLAGAEKILDLGGGAGTFAEAFVILNPKARVTVLDVPAALEVARKVLPADLIGDRIILREGDFLEDDLGTGYDLAFLSSIIHIYDDETNRAIVGKVFDSLASGGTIAIRDFILDEEGLSPDFAALFAVNMLVNTKGGKTYREAEVAGWLSASGFEGIERVDLPEATSLVKGKKPA